MRTKVISFNIIICLITAVFFCLFACDNGSAPDSDADKTSGLVKVSLTVDAANSSQKSISVSSDIDSSNFKYYYKAIPQWSQSSPIHGTTNNQFLLIPNYSAGANLGYFTAGEWVFVIQIKNGNNVIYEGSSDVISVASDNFAVNVLVNKIIELASGTVSVSVTAPTVTSEAMTVAWTGTASGSGSATAIPLGDGTTRFTYTKSDFSSGVYTFTLNHSSTGSGAAIAVDLRPGERVEITGHLNNGTWQIGYITVKIYSVNINATGCSVQSNVNAAAAGEKVSFYITPFAGNVLDNVSVAWAGGAITPAVSSGLYTFTMPGGDVSVDAVYSGVSSDILVEHFKSILKIIHDSNPGATSFGRSLVGPDDSDEYFEVKNVKMWYDSTNSKICWYSDNQNHTMKFQSGALTNLFKDCTNFTSITMEGMDTSAITDMSGMFQNCTALTNLDLTDLKTGNVTNMSYMFCGCRALTSLVLDDEKDANGKFVNFNTANVTDMSYMFSSQDSAVEPPPAMNLESLDVSGFDTAKVTNMSQMFYLCYKLTELDVSGFRTPLVTDMSYMFACYNWNGALYPGHLTELNLADWAFTNVTSVAHMFDRQESLDDLTFPEETNFKSLTTMTYLFSHCLALTPETFRTIVASWKFSEQDNYQTTIYGNGNTSMFGNAENNNKGSNNGANYIFRESTMTKSGGKFATRNTTPFTTKDAGYELYIGGGSSSKYARLTTVVSP